MTVNKVDRPSTVLAASLCLHPGQREGISFEKIRSSLANCGLGANGLPQRLQAASSIAVIDWFLKTRRYPAALNTCLSSAAFSGQVLTHDAQRMHWA